MIAYQPPDLTAGGDPDAVGVVLHQRHQTRARRLPRRAPGRRRNAPRLAEPLQNRSMQIALSSGAGVAGAALAHRLHVPAICDVRIPGCADISAAAANTSTSGASATKWRNAWASRDMIGAVVRSQIERLRCVGPGGEVKVDVDVDIFRRMIGDEVRQLARGDLAAAVYATIEDKVETIFGDNIATVDQRQDRVHLTFERNRTA